MNGYSNISSRMSKNSPQVKKRNPKVTKVSPPPSRSSFSAADVLTILHGLNNSVIEFTEKDKTGGFFSVQCKKPNDYHDEDFDLKVIFRYTAPELNVDDGGETNEDDHSQKNIVFQLSVWGYEIATGRHSFPTYRFFSDIEYAFGRCRPMLKE